jgi:hypothetical protein
VIIVIIIILTSLIIRACRARIHSRVQVIGDVTDIIIYLTENIFEIHKKSKIQANIYLCIDIAHFELLSQEQRVDI